MKIAGEDVAMGLIYEDKTQILRRCFFDVQNEVGLGRQEQAYHRACDIWLREYGVPFQYKPPHPIMLHGEVVHTLYPDLVAWDAITVELKAVPRSLNPSEFAQLFDYLKCRNDRLGLLVNMGLDRVSVERIVYDTPDYEFEEDWQYWTDHIEGADRETGLAIRDAVRTLFKAHGTGYSHEITQKLLLHELRRRGLACVPSPLAKSVFHGIVVDESPLDCLVVEGRIVLVYTVLFDTNSFNVNRGKSYMEAIGLRWGVAVDFGRTKVEIAGLRDTGNGGYTTDGTQDHG